MTFSYMTLPSNLTVHVGLHGSLQQGSNKVIHYHYRISFGVPMNRAAQYIVNIVYRQNLISYYPKLQISKYRL